ncbi:hypothetical protein GGQ85_000345 [Nitrobacter vulgaris]|nr:hypothetical protein [Nitrobacter vulgaris]
MRYLLIAICATTILSTSALAFSGKNESGKGDRGYEGRVYLAYDSGGGYTPAYHRRGYGPSYSGLRPHLVFRERCSFTNDPSC